jgi:hypothetical protein
MAERGPDGRFLIGHKPISPGRPIGAANVLTRTLREKILDGFGGEDGVTRFVADLKRDCPAAAALLLSKLLPPVEVEGALRAAASPVVVNVRSVPTDFYVVNPDETPADALMKLEYVPPNVAAPQVEILPPPAIAHDVSREEEERWRAELSTRSLDELLELAQRAGLHVAPEQID